MQVPRKTPRYLLFFTFSFALASLAFGKSVVLFSPDDKPTKHLIQHINAAQTRIYAAVYMLTDKRIAQALIDAKNRGVDVQIVTDQATSESPYGKAGLLKENNVETNVFFTVSPHFNNFNPLMHHKFAIIDNHVWTGSFNWTVSANSKNQENVIYTDEKEVCDKYLAQFEKLKQRCLVLAEKKKRLQEQAAAVAQAYTQASAQVRPGRSGRGGRVARRGKRVVARAEDHLLRADE